MKIKRSILFTVIGVLISTVGCTGITFSIKQQHGKKGFALVFNDKTDGSSTGHRKSSRKNRNHAFTGNIRGLDLQSLITDDETSKISHSRRLSLGAAVGGAAIGGAAAGAGGALINKMMNKSTKEILREKTAEYRSLQLQNDSEKENLAALFRTKIKMSRLVSMTNEIKSAIEFMIHRKLAMLQQTLPEISV